MSEKQVRNSRVAERWDELTRIGAHGHYETLFRVVREEVEAERERCAKIAESVTARRRIIRAGINGEPVAGCEIAAAIRRAA